MLDSQTKTIEGVVWDWGDTLMRNLPDQEGPMARWPHVEAMPGAAEALSALSELSVQCIATNAGDSTGSMVAAALARVGLADHLAHFFTSGEMGVKKPDSAFFETVSKNLGIEPSKLLAVGNDLRKDVQPAKAIGMTTVLVSPEAPPSADGADFTVTNLTELASLVQDGLLDS